MRKITGGAQLSDVQRPSSTKSDVKISLGFGYRKKLVSVFFNQKNFLGKNL